MKGTVFIEWWFSIQHKGCSSQLGAILLKVTIAFQNKNSYNSSNSRVGKTDKWEVEEGTWWWFCPLWYRSSARIHHQRSDTFWSFIFSAFLGLRVLLTHVAAVRVYARMLALRLCSGGLPSGGLLLERHGWPVQLGSSVFPLVDWQGRSTFPNSRPPRLGSKAGRFKKAFRWQVYFLADD